MHWPDNFTSSVRNRDAPSRRLLAFVASFLWTKRSMFSAYEHGGSGKVHLDWMLLTLMPRNRNPPQSMLYISNRSAVILNVLHKLIRTWIQCWYEVGRFCLLLFFFSFFKIILSLWMWNKTVKMMHRFNFRGLHRNMTFTISELQQFNEKWGKESCWYLTLSSLSNSTTTCRQHFLTGRFYSYFLTGWVFLFICNWCSRSCQEIL